MLQAQFSTACVVQVKKVLTSLLESPRNFFRGCPHSVENAYCRAKPLAFSNRSPGHTVAPHSSSPRTRKKRMRIKVAARWEEEEKCRRRRCVGKERVKMQSPSPPGGLSFVRCPADVRPRCERRRPAAPLMSAVRLRGQLEGGNGGFVLSLAGQGSIFDGGMGTRFLFPSFIRVPVPSIRPLFFFFSRLLYHWMSK